METVLENKLDAYNTYKFFTSKFPRANLERQLEYANEYYRNAIGGYILRDRNVVYYLLHYTCFDDEWNNKVNYHKMESKAFFVPVRFIELASMENTNTVVVFIIHSQLYYILPKQLQTFYRNNELYVDSDYHERFIPVPLKLLQLQDPYYQHI